MAAWVAIRLRDLHLTLSLATGLLNPSPDSRGIEVFRGDSRARHLEGIWKIIRYIQSGFDGFDHCSFSGSWEVISPAELRPGNPTVRRAGLLDFTNREAEPGKPDSPKPPCLLLKSLELAPNHGDANRGRPAALARGLNSKLP